MTKEFGQPRLGRRLSWLSILFIALLFSTLSNQAWAQCNSGTTVTGTLEVSASCDGNGIKPLTLDTGGALTVDSGVTVSNDAFSGRNGDGVTVLSSATSSTIINNGTISTGSQIGVINNGVLNSLTNFGTITSGVRRGIVNNGSASLVTLTNVGTIGGAFANVTQNGTSTIGTFNNLQGAGNGSGAVTIVNSDGNANGGLPAHYNIIIRSTSQYGQLSSEQGGASMSFNIYGNTGTTLVSGVAASTLVTGTYADVLQNFTTLTGVTGTTGTYNNLSYSLVADNSHSGDWNLVVTNASFTSAATSNQSSIQNMFNRLSASATGSFGTLISNIGGLSAAGQQQAFEQLVSSVGSDVQNAGIANVRAMMSGLQSRLSGSPGGSGTEAPMAEASFKEVQIADASDSNWASFVNMNTNSNLIAWIDGFGDFNSIRGNSSAPGMHSTLGGGSVGLEARLDTDTRAGIMFGAANNYFNIDNVSQWGSQNSYVIGLYGSKGLLGGSKNDGIILDGSVMAGYNTADSNRQVGIVGGTARGETDGYSFAASTGVSYPLSLADGSILTPRAGLAYTYNYENGYTETGAPGANLDVKGNGQNLLQTSLGATIKHTFKFAVQPKDKLSNTLTPEISIGWLHEALDPRTSVTESFDGIADSSFSSSGATPARDAAALGFGLTLIPADASTTIFARYEAALSSNQTDQSVVAGLRFNW